MSYHCLGVTGKAVVTTLNTADTPSQVRRKVEKITYIGSLEVYRHVHRNVDGQI